MTDGEITGTVFDIERFSLHDGRGIRTVVFLKGCPLHCGWCANPESNCVEPQIGFFPEKCGLCRRCVDVCPWGAQFVKEGKIDFGKCTGCMKCTEVCPYEARVSYGRIMTAGDVVGELLRDSVFYKNSDGGVTLSGGEVCMQPDFAAAILRMCQAEGIHTAIETSGFAAWNSLSKVIAHVDLLLFDFKCMDSERHKFYTGGDNRIILENACRASEIVEEMVIRWPLIPGVNDSEQNAQAMADFLIRKMPKVKRVDILPYHSAGKSKCSHIGRSYGYEPPYELNEEKISQMQSILLALGLDVRVGG